MQRLSKRRVIGQSDVSQSLVEASDGSAIHLVVQPVAAVDPDDGGLVAIGLGIHAGSTECLRPIRGETLDMLGMETVAERMADYFAWATTTTMARYHRSADDVPDGLTIPRWSWDGLQE